MRRTVLIALAVLAGAAPASAAVPQATITLDPPDGVPGSTITVSGRGFCAEKACPTVGIEIYGVPVAEGVHVTADGTFTRRVKVPGGPSGGEIGVVATQFLPDGSVASAFATFEVAVRDPDAMTEGGEEEEREREKEEAREEQEREANESGEETEAPAETQSPGSMISQVDAGAPSPTQHEAAGAITAGDDGWPASIWVAGFVFAALLGVAAGMITRRIRQR
jgi:hypothetical protein